MSPDPQTFLCRKCGEQITEGTDCGPGHAVLTCKKCGEVHAVEYPVEGSVITRKQE